jgi:hypothetical protein
MEHTDIKMVEKHGNWSILISKLPKKRRNWTSKLHISYENPTFYPIFFTFTYPGPDKSIASAVGPPFPLFFIYKIMFLSFLYIK